MDTGIALLGLAIVLVSMGVLLLRNKKRTGKYLGRRGTPFDTDDK